MGKHDKAKIIQEPLKDVVEHKKQVEKGIILDLHEEGILNPRTTTCGIAFYIPNEPANKTLPPLIGAEAEIKRKKKSRYSSEFDTNKFPAYVNNRVTRIRYLQNIQGRKNHLKQNEVEGRKKEFKINKMERKHSRFCKSENEK